MTTKAHGATWRSQEKVDEYLARVGGLPARIAGEGVLAEILPPSPASLLDLGCGDGRLAGLALAARPSIACVLAVDRSEPMLAAARTRFAGDGRVRVSPHDLDLPITGLGSFDVIVSGFAIHHLEHERKQSLFAEIASALEPGGLFANLEVIECATEPLQRVFYDAIGRADGDPEDRLAAIEPQLGWMRAAGCATSTASGVGAASRCSAGEAPRARSQTPMAGCAAHRVFARLRRRSRKLPRSNSALRVAGCDAQGPRVAADRGLRRAGKLEAEPRRSARSAPPGRSTQRNDLRAPLGVQRAAVDRERGFLQRLAHRRVRMAGARDVLGRRAELERDHGLGDQIAGHRAQDVHAEHAVALRVGEDLHEPWVSPVIFARAFAVNGNLPAR